jgi:hypothetical protein
LLEFLDQHGAEAHCLVPVQHQRNFAEFCGMKYAQGHAGHDSYRVILKREEGEFEIGSIGIQHGRAWSWGIDTVIPSL